MITLTQEQVKQPFEEFKQGLVEAVSINNDSRYITEEIILKTPKVTLSSFHKTKDAYLKEKESRYI